MRGPLAPIALGAALALAGCETAGPNYSVPAAAVVKSQAATGAFVGARGDRAVAQTAPSDGWWRLYDDPRLDSLVEQALKANTDLRAADANLERSHGLLAEAKAAGRPNLTFNLDADYAQLSAEAYLRPQMVPSTGLYDVGLTLSYQLDLFGRIRRGIEAATADDEAVQATRDLVRVNVAAEVTRAYMDVCSAGAELTAARRSLALQQQSIELTQRLIKAGRGVPLDFTRGQGQLDQLRANVPALLARQRNAEYRLATLAGRPPTTFDAGLDTCVAPPWPSRPIPVGDGAALLRRRPDVRAAERRLAASTATIGVRMAALYPQVSLGATLGSTGAATSAFSDLTNRYGVGPNIVWRLDHTADRARIEQAQAQTRADLARFDGAVLTALREVESALNVYSHDLERDASLKAAQVRASQAVVDQQRLEAGGRVNALATLDAERTLAVVDQAVAASRGQLAADQVGLFLALGGGWEMGETPKP
jgi:NodT family efflux transporter outer membrane factor (OMF) lipoprotein